MKKRSIALVLAFCVALSMALAGCGQKKKRDFIVPPFEKFQAHMTSEEVAEIIGVKVAKTTFTSKKDSILGYAYRRDEYKILQSDGVVMDFNCVINTEENVIDHAIFNVSDPYKGEDGFTDAEMQLLKKHSEFIVNYFKERLGDPEVKVEGELTTYIWYLGEEVKIYLKDGVEYSWYDLELWWNYFPKA